MSQSHDPHRTRVDDDCGRTDHGDKGRQQALYRAGGRQGWEHREHSGLPRQF